MKKIKLSTRQITLLLHVLFWGLVCLIPLWFHHPGASYTMIGGIPVPFYLIAVFLCAFLFYGNAFFLYPKLCNRRWWVLYILSCIGLIVLVNHFKVMLLDLLFPAVHIYGANAPFIFAPTVLALLVSTLYCYVADRIRTSQQQQQQAAEQLEMELKFLRSQINPHFLFNVLTTLVALARKKSDKLEPSLLMLSDLMRYMMADTNEQRVPLDKELAYLENYIALQRLRFEPEVQIESVLHADDSSNSLRIAPMILIPFIENAFKHGVGWIEKPWIHIALQVEAKQLVLHVDNKFNASDQKDVTSGIGLQNVRSRLKLLYPKRYGLAVTQQDDIFHIHLTLQL